MPQPIIQEIEREQLRADLPSFGPGDTVRVHAKVIEGGKERIQIFEGVVIAMKRGSARSCFTVRKISHTVGVERTFLLNSPKIARIEVTRRGKVRRAKLYFLRGRVGRQARIKERREERPVKGTPRAARQAASTPAESAPVAPVESMESTSIDTGTGETGVTAPE